MAVVSVQLGQCGNAIGTELFTALADTACGANSTEDFQRSTYDAFFRAPDRDSAGVPVARALLVDTEPKVIAAQTQLARRGALFNFASRATYSSQSGAANNWAYGYSVHGPACRERLSELLRREAEHCDRLGGFLLLHSVAGGTGSGLGCYAGELIRDMFPSSQCVSHAVWPHEKGEVCVQNYNGILAMGHLLDSVDAILVTQNDDIHAVCQDMLRMPKVSIGAMNAVIAGQLAQYLLPARLSQEAQYAYNPLEVTCSRLCPHPLYKFATIRSVPQLPDASIPFSTLAWPGLLTHLRQMQATGAAMDLALDWSLGIDDVAAAARTRRRSVCAALASLVVCRGTESDAGAEMAAKPEIFGQTGLYSPSVPLSHPLTVAFAHTPFRGLDKTAVLVCMLARASRMLAAGAYFHRYSVRHIVSLPYIDWQAHGVEEDEMRSLLARCEQVLDDYNRL